MDAHEQTVDVTLKCGVTYTARELSAADVCEYQEAGYTMDQVRAGEIPATSFWFWLMIRDGDRKTGTPTLADFRRQLKLSDSKVLGKALEELSRHPFDSSPEAETS